MGRTDAAAGAVPQTADAHGLTRLDTVAPVWQFREVHAIAVRAPVDRAYAAATAVTAREIRFYRAMTWLRRFGRPGPPDILNPPPDDPILEVATRTGFVLLAASPPGEIVVGKAVIAPRGAAPRTPEEFRAITGPGFALATMNFRVEPAGPGRSVVTTETRVHATDARTRRRFGVYWLVIRAGSGLIRRMWLRAIKRRAEQVG